VNNSSIYSSPEAKSEILDLYKNKLNSLDISYISKVVKTNFGETNVVIVGDQSKRPFVVVHGSNGNAAVGIEPLIPFSSDHCLYAIDVIGQPNLSSEQRPSMKDDSYAIWLDNVLEELNLRDVLIYGMSFGGFIINKTLVHRSDRISRAILHVPAGVVNGNPFIGIFKVLIPMKRYIKTKDKKYLMSFLDMAFTERDEFAISFLAKVLLHLKMDFTPVPTLTKKEGSKITKPVHVITADKDAFFPGLKVLKRLNKILPTLKSQLLLNNCKHVPDRDSTIKLQNFIREVIDNS